MIERYKKYEPLFGAWKITRLIGKGSFGEVYEMERDNFGITYKAALKAITIPVDESELNELMSSGMSMAETKQYIKQSAKDIVNEFVLMSKLKGNTNIVSYEDHQVIEHEDKLGWDILMKMELLQPMNQYLKSRDFTEKDLVKLGIDLCTALELCEKYNIVHRDIKPENIFVSPNGDFKLGDFGIARSIEKATLGMSKKGTYTYMAPEVYKGESYALTVDIYSLGMVMYKLMNHNRVPFMPSYPQAIAYSDRESSLVKRMNGEKIARPDGGHCERLIEIILKACEYMPERRYQNAAQMKEELLEILESVEETVLIAKSGRAGRMSVETTSARKIKKAAPKEEEEPEEIEKTILLDREELTPASENTKTPSKLLRWKMPMLAAGGLMLVMVILFAAIRIGIHSGPDKPDGGQILAATPPQEEEGLKESAQETAQISPELDIKKANENPNKTLESSETASKAVSSTQPAASSKVLASAKPSASAAEVKITAPVKQTAEIPSKPPVKQTIKVQTKAPVNETTQTQKKQQVKKVPDTAPSTSPSTAPKATAGSANKPPEIYVDFDE